MIRIGLVDDHTVFREGMQALLKTQQDFEVCAEFASGEEFLANYKNHNPDLVLLDLKLGEGMNGLEVCQLVKQESQAPGIIILSEEADPRFVAHLYESGADAYLTKSTSSYEIFHAIRSTFNNGSYINELANSALLKALRSKTRKKPSLDRPIGISDREAEIIQLICNELTSQEIGEKLFISKNTVDNHRQNIIEKIGAKNIIGIVKFAIKNGLYEI